MLISGALVGDAIWRESNLKAIRQDLECELFGGRWHIHINTNIKNRRCITWMYQVFLYDDEESFELGFVNKEAGEDFIEQHWSDWEETKVELSTLFAI